MNKIASALASLLLIMPLSGIAAFASNVSGEPAVTAAPAEADVADTYRCCWVFYNGMWYCMPC